MQFQIENSNFKYQVRGYSSPSNSLFLMLLKKLRLSVQDFDCIGIFLVIKYK